MKKLIGVVKTTLPGEWNDMVCGSWCCEFIQLGLAACVSRQTVTSVFNWEAELQSVREWHVEFKTSVALVDELIAQISKSHPYEVPMVISSALNATISYAEWIDNVCKKSVL